MISRESIREVLKKHGVRSVRITQFYPEEKSFSFEEGDDDLISDLTALVGSNEPVQ